MIRMPTCVHGNIRMSNSKCWHSNDERITSILFSGSTLRFLMTTENQDLISASFSQYCVTSLSLSCCNRPGQIAGWAPPAGHSNTSKSNLSISCSFWYWPGFQFQPLASVVNQASTAGIVNISSVFVCLLLIYTAFLSLSSSMTQEVIAPQEKLRLRTRKKEATTSCMPEPHQETSLTTTSSPSAAFATSARCWIRRDSPALSVRFYPPTRKWLMIVV